MTDTKIIEQKISNSQKIFFTFVLTLIVITIFAYASAWITMLSNLRSEQDLLVGVKKIQSNIMSMEHEFAVAQNTISGAALSEVDLVKFIPEKYLSRDNSEEIIIAALR